MLVSWQESRAMMTEQLVTYLRRFVVLLQNLNEVGNGEHACKRMHAS